MELPDIIGICLGDAKIILDRNFFETVEVKLTQAPKKSKSSEHENRNDNSINDGSRVIKAGLAGKGKVKLLVCNVESVAGNTGI